MSEFRAIIKTKYSGEGERILQVSHYLYGKAPALTIYELDGEPLLTASVCLDPINPKPNHIILKGWSENEGIEAALVKAGLISAVPAAAHPTGFVIAGEWEMRGALLEAWHSHCKSERLEL